MPEDDLYSLWLKIPPGPRPPDYHTLLGVPRTGANLQQIEAAAQARLTFLDRYALHKDLTRRDACQRMMNEVAQARVALAKELKRAAAATEHKPPSVVKTSAPPASPPAASAPAKSVPSARTRSVQFDSAKPAEAVVTDIAATAPIKSGRDGLFRRLKTAPALATAAGIGLLGVGALAVLLVQHRKPADRVSLASSRGVTEPGTDQSQARTPKNPSVEPSSIKPVAAPITPAVVHPVVQPAPAPKPAQLPSIVHADPVNHTPVLPSPPVKPPTPAPAPSPVVAQPSKSAIPNAAQQEVAGKMVDIVFADEIKNAKSADQRSAIAKKMLTVAADTRGDLAAQYLLYSEATTVAAQAGDISTAMTAVDDAAGAFEIDALKIKSRALIVAVKLSESWRDLDLFLGKCDAVVDDAIEVDRYDIATETVVVPLAIPDVKRDSTLARRVRSRIQYIEGLSEEYRKVAAAHQTLHLSPTDPDANAAMGRFRCFFKEDWTGGLPLLAIGAASPAQSVAKQEQIAGTDPAKLGEVADGWWDLAESQPEPVRARVRHHAAEIYYRVIPQLTGLSHRLAEKRLDDFETSSAQVVNLLAMIDVNKDAAPGRCKMQKDGIVFDPSGPTRSILRLRYCPPKEYNLEIEFTSSDSRVCVEHFLTHNGHLFAWALGMTGVRDFSSLDTFDAIDKRIPNSSSINGPILTERHSFVSVVKVREDRVTAMLDGRQLADVVTDYSNLNLSSEDDQTRTIDNGLGLSVAMGPVLFTKIRLVEITGTGHPIAHRNADGSPPQFITR